MNTTKNGKTHFMTQCALFAAIMCICSPISIPIGSVPISLGLFAVMLAGVVLNWKQAAVSVLVFVLIGMCGVPVFSGGKGGFAVLAGPTGGYIWSYVFTAMIISLICSVKTQKRFVINFAACIAGTVICYAAGTAQFVLVMEGTTVAKALAVCVYPFIAFDIAKAVCASLLGEALKKRLKLI